MKRTLFLILALCTLSTASWGAVTTVTYVVGDTATKYSWASLSTHPDLQMDAQISVNATHDPNSSNTNGTYSSNQWYAYKADNSGEFSINASAGYWIQSIAVNNNPQKGGTLVKKGTETQIPSDETPVAVNAQSITFNVINGTSGNICARILRFIVTYDVAPTGISLNVPAAMNATVGNKFQIIATVAPSTTVFQAVKWTTNNASAVDVDQNGIIDVKGTGQATITATTVNGKTATCVIDAAADAGENFIEDYTKLQATSGSYSGKKTYTADNGINWMARNYKKEDATKIGGDQGVELPGGNNYIAYNTAQEGGVKSISFQWRATDATKPVLFNIDDMSSTIYKTHLTPNADYANAQTYSRDIQYNENMYLRIRVNTDEVAQADLSPIVFGPLTITPYLFYTNKTVDVYTDGYINDDLINNTTGEDVVYSLIGDGDGDRAEINTSTGALTIKAEGTVTVQASWNSGKVTTTYSATLHKSPAPIVSFTDGEAVTKSMNVETYTNALNWTSDPTKCGAVTYESDNEEVAKFADETVNVLSIVGAGKVNITAHIAKGSEFAAKDLTYELTVEDPNEDAIIEKFTAYKSEGWTSNVTTEAERNGDCFDWNVYLARYKAGDDVIESERAVCFNAGGTTKDGYIVSKEVVEGGIKRIGFNWKKNGVADGTFQVIVGSNTHTINSGATTVTKAAYNHNFFEKISNATLKIFNNTQSKLWVGEIKITPYLLYKKENKTPSISALEYVGVKTYKNEDIINNTNGGTIEYTIISQSPENIAEILDANKNTGDVTIYGGGTVTVQAKWEDVTTTYTLTIEKATPTIEFGNTEIDIFGTYTPAPVAKIGENVISDAVFTYSSGEPKVATVDGSVFTINRTGTSKITATLVAGATYESVNAEATLTVNKPTTGAWEETYVNFEATTGYNTGTSFKSNGKDGVYQWQSRTYRCGSAKDKVNGENGVSLNRGIASNNYLAFNTPYEGGVKDIFFNWQLLGTTNRTAKFNISMDTYSEDVTVENAVANDYYSCAKHVNYKGNAMLKLSIPEGGDSIVFGPITITPYLLYTTKTVDINVADYLGKDPYINNDIINNTDKEGFVTYSIKSQEPAGIASIADDTKGEVTILGAGTVVVQVAWSEGASTTYTLNIARTNLDPATLNFQQAGPLEKNIDDAPFTNELTGVPETGCGDVKYSTNKPSVAMVNENTGEVTIKGAGDATITATVLQGTIYNQVTKTYQISVDGTSENKTITETFKKYERSGSGWGSSVNPAAEREGDYFDWNVYLARHDSTSARDYLYGNAERATWLSADGGYIESQEAVEGGIKRINFKWNKYQTGTRTVSFSVIVDGVADNVSEELVTESGVGQRNPDAEYSHNFLSKKNSTLKFLNTGNTNMEIGEITITPYIYFPKRCDTIIATEYIGKKAYAPLVTMDNTNSDGTITYDSDNKEVAEVNNNGIVTIKAASATPVKITMIWQPSDQVETVTASYLLLVSDKQDRQAEFAQSDMTVARGEVINDVNNKLTIYTVQGDVPTTPAYTLESADTCVAKVIDNEVHAIAPGNTVITAHIDATSKCKALDISYTLHVNYTPTGQYWFETLKNIQGGAGDKATTEAVNGEDGIANKWYVTNVFHKDQINGKTGTRVRYSSSIATNEGVSLEGGIKEVLFSWRVFNNSFPTHFTVTAGSKPYEYRHGILASADDVQPFAHDFNVKSNVALSISNAADETPNSQSHIIIDSIKVIPYLYYTRKDTTLVASEMEGVYTYSNNKLINNTEDAVADHFSYTVRAKDNAVSIADSHSDQLTIIGAGTDTIQAAWDGVTTTYVVHVVLEDAALDFAEKTPVVLLGTGSYTQTASKSTTADVKYEFEGEHGTATINETTGEVIFNGQTGELHILASVPVALPYNLDSARYVLTVNNKPTPTVVFDPKTVDMNAAAFTPEAKTIPSSGMGTASYESSNEEVAKIEEGKVTIVGEGTSTISVHYEEGDEWGEADADFLLTVEDPNEDAITENFANDDNWQKACTTEIDIDGLFGWKTYLTRHRSTGDNKDALTSGEQATWFNTSGDAYLKSANAIEGGIKRVAFNWKKETATAPNVPSFTVKVDNVPIVVDATDRTGIDQRFNHNYFVKKNVVLEIDNNTASLLRVGAIKITPYLYYETKKCTLDLKVKDNFKNEDLIDNRDDKATSSINYSIIAGNEGSIAEIAADGTVTATAGGEITVQAQWSTNTSVTTTYTLTILPSKTTINLMRNDGTEDKDVIENNIGEVMPEFTLPTRDNYRFNAYFIDQACTAKRFTVTTLTYTGWVSNITYNKVNYTGEDRIWTYSGNDAVTLYADWKAERTITLDNQEATTAGTEKVVTAYCPNNNTVNLMDPITIPQKDNNIFLGYYTEEEGAGTQLIDANGAFIANVTGYTDTENNYKKWKYDKDITLYAAWKEAVVLDENNTTLAGVIEENDGQSVSVLLKRNLKSAYYNTICLPFALDADQVVAVFGEGTKIAELSSTATIVGDPEALDIFFEYRTAIEAGKPYLIKPANNVESVLIEDVTISKTFTNLTKGNATMTCVVSKVTDLDVHGLYFLAQNDILVYYTNATVLATPQTMKGMRAYFSFSTSAAPKRARCVFGHGVTTDIPEVGETELNEPKKVILNGNLYIIREGNTYDAQGRLIK